MIYSFVVALGLLFTYQGQAKSPSLTINIHAIREPKGLIQIELLNDQKISVAHKTIVATMDAKVTFSDLPSGEYAVRLFHDQNNNEKLDTNLIGIPTEGYGFSNDAHGMFGPYPFKRWLVGIEGDTIITITLNYL